MSYSSTQVMQQKSMLSYRGATTTAAATVKCGHPVGHSDEPAGSANNSKARDSTKQVHCCGLDFMLLPFSKCPHHFCDNPYIKTGYRHDYTFKQAMLSLFMFRHNESVNVWTHLLGFFIMIGLAFDAFFVRIVDGDVIDYLAMGIFLSSAMYVMFASSCFHLFRCISEEYDSLFLRLDAAGIGCIIWGSFVPPAAYLFRGHEYTNIMHFYITVVTALFLMCTAATLSEKFSHVDYFLYRVITFIAFGSFGLVPIFHLYLLGIFQPGELAFQMLVPLFVVVGVLFHVFRVPERFFPGVFDIVGHGHQIFHVLVLAALVSHYFSCVGYFEHRFYDLV